MPNRYGPAMRIFTKVIKIPFTFLRKKGHVSVVYVIDSYLQGKTMNNACIDNMDVLQELGFTMHPIKSCLSPKQKIIFSGFEIDSYSMTTNLTKEKKRI